MRFRRPHWCLVSRERCHTSVPPSEPSSSRERRILPVSVSIPSLGDIGSADHCPFAGADTLTGMDAESALQALHLVEHVQITYGAIILSFLGAIHWGMEFSRFQGTFGYSRLALGVIPVLYAWPTTFLAHGTALVAQWFGFTGTWLLDQKASTNGWSGYFY